MGEGFGTARQQLDYYASVPNGNTKGVRDRFWP